MNQNKLLHITGNIRAKKGTLYIQRIVDTSLVAIDTINIDSSSVFSDIELQSWDAVFISR
jgi:hypothetical protein